MNTKLLDNLFVFPIVMVDGDNEDRKSKQADMLNIGTDSEIDLIEGEAECPYYDFVSVSDRWLPTQASLDKAIEGNFEACGVVFSSSGTFICSWNKKKFKRELAKFIKSLPEEEEIKFMTKEELERELKNDV